MIWGFFLQALSLQGKNLLSATAVFSAKSFHHLAKTFENIKVIYNNILQQNAALVILEMSTIYQYAKNRKAPAKILATIYRSSTESQQA